MTGSATSRGATSTKITTTQSPSQISGPPARSPNVFESVAEVGALMGGTAVQLGKAAVDTAASVGSVIANTAGQTGKAVAETTAGVGNAIGNTVAQTGKVAVNSAFALGGVIEDSVAHSSKAAIETAQWLGETTTKQTFQWLESATQGAGHAVKFAGDNWLVRRLSGVLKLDWLVGAADRVDLGRAEADVRSLQRQYPNESPSQIAHRLMVQKAAYAGGTGLVSSLIPGAALALLAVDFAATTALQAEMVYQIAAAYGLDLKDPARKGEVLAIFGLALGGGRALKAGLGLVRNVPMAGAIIGASTNATMTYALGYAACRFYEAKLKDSSLSPESETLNVLTAESDQYLDRAIVQQATMDQILVHMIVASHPNKSWEQILPSLAALQLSPASLEAIAANLKSPKPLEELLNQLNRDYAIPLLALCYRISQIDEDRSPAEAEVLQRISRRFDIDLENIKQMVQGRVL